MGKRVMVIDMPGERRREDRSGGSWIAPGTTYRRERAVRGKNSIPN